VSSATTEHPADQPSEAERFFALWAVLRRDPHAANVDGPTLAATTAEIEAGTTIRGIYDVSGLRADADILLWLTGDSAEGLQASLRTLRRSRELAPLLPTWNALGVHRDAEFTREHSPAFARGLPPKGWLCVYPFVRSYDWYILPPDDRRAMLGEHGRKGSEFRQVQANTVASFALGDYEWILALEADDPVDLVDLMRHLRATEARRHVREEVPFFTGRRIDATDVAEVLS
jgi:chlorite dismutase